MQQQTQSVDFLEESRLEALDRVGRVVETKITMVNRLQFALDIKHPNTSSFSISKSNFLSIQHAVAYAKKVIAHYQLETNIQHAYVEQLDQLRRQPYYPYVSRDLQNKTRIVFRYLAYRDRLLCFADFSAAIGLICTMKETNEALQQLVLLGYVKETVREYCYGYRRHQCAQVHEYVLTSKGKQLAIQDYERVMTQ